MDLAFLYNSSSAKAELGMPFVRIGNTSSGFSLPHSIGHDYRSSLRTMEPLAGRPDPKSRNDYLRNEIQVIDSPDIALFNTPPDHGINVVPLRYTAELFENITNSTLIGPSMLTSFDARWEGECTRFYHPASGWYLSAGVFDNVEACGAGGEAPARFVLLETVLPSREAPEGKATNYFAWCSDSLALKTATIAEPRICPSVDFELLRDSDDGGRGCVVLTGQEPGAKDCSKESSDYDADSAELQNHNADPNWKQSLDMACRKLIVLEGAKLRAVGVDFTNHGSYDDRGTWTAHGGFAYPDCSPYPGRLGVLFGRLLAEADAKQPAGCSPKNVLDGFQADKSGIDNGGDTIELSEEECAHGQDPADGSASMDNQTALGFVNEHTKTLWATSLGGIHGYDTIRFRKLNWVLPVLDRSAVQHLDEELTQELARTDTILSAAGAIFILFMSVGAAVGACELGASLERIMKARPFKPAFRLVIRTVVAVLVVVASLIPLMFVLMGELSAYNNNTSSSGTISYFQVSTDPPGYSSRHPLGGQKMVGLVMVKTDYTTSFVAAGVLYLVTLGLVGFMVIMYCAIMYLPVSCFGPCMRLPKSFARWSRHHSGESSRDSPSTQFKTEVIPGLGPRCDVTDSIGERHTVSRGAL